MTALTDILAPASPAVAGAGDAALDLRVEARSGAWLARGVAMFGRAALLLLFASLSGFLVIRLLPAARP